MKRKLLILVNMSLLEMAAFGQGISKTSYGKISPDDFKPTVYTVDSNAAAVIIADVGSTEIVGNTKGWFSLEYKHYRRVHILNKNAYDIADVAIPLYTNGEKEEELESLKAATYNLENGQIVETRLDIKNNVFRDRINKNLVSRKFTFPDVKSGSIIEYEYKVKSDFLFNLQPWEFQGTYPRLWSEYNISIPEFINYIFITQGYQALTRDRKDTRKSFTVIENTGVSASDRHTFVAAVSNYRWVLKNVPVLKEESFTSTLKNHISKIEFQLSEFRNPLPEEKKLETWAEFTKEFLEADYFGSPLTKDNGWLGDMIDPVTSGITDESGKARHIYAFLRDNFTCTSYNDIVLNQPLRNIARRKKGSVSEINLLLVAMLHYAGILADPVILSTRDHGYTYADYPLVDKFNYVIVRARIGGKDYYLDASEPRLGFGKLGFECYNGHARVIDTDATPVEFNSDSLVEKSVTSIFVINDQQGNFIGTLQKTPGYYESCHLRDLIKEKGRDQVFDEIKKSFGGEMDISDASVDSIDKYEESVNIKYKFDIKPGSDDIIYFNPMLTEGYKENPFKSAKRLYPVEMPYTLDETYLLQMEVPKGYVVDELPKQVMVKLNETDDGMFEYRISAVNGSVSLRSRLRIKRSYFQPDEYDALREFFNLVVKKHSEQIVFKKEK